MSEIEKPGSEYDVGYGKPPKEHQFKKGQSGNSDGRPKTKGKVKIDLNAIFDGPVTVKKGDKEVKMQPREVEIRKFVKKALVDKDFRAIRYLTDLFIQHGAFEPEQVEQYCGVLELPSANLPWGLALEAAEVLGVPPWKDKDLAPLVDPYMAGLSLKEAACTRELYPVIAGVET